MLLSRFSFGSSVWCPRYIVNNDRIESVQIHMWRLNPNSDYTDALNHFNRISLVYHRIVIDSVFLDTLMNNSCKFKLSSSIRI